MKLVKKIISGGQTGADRAGLDFAIEQGIPHGGWIPKGRLTEDGALDPKYKLKETKSKLYEERTKKNVIDSDATAIFCYDELTGGSLHTFQLTKKRKKPVLLIKIGFSVPSQKEFKDWLKQNHIKVLNIAGPRISNFPNIYDDTMRILKEFFS